MEVKINLHLTVDKELLSLLSALTGGKGTAPVSKTQAQTSETKEEKPAAGGATVSIEKIREAAGKLMVKDKAKLKAILTKYNAKTVAALDDSDIAAAYADIAKALK